MKCKLKSRGPTVHTLQWRHQRDHWDMWRQARKSPPCCWERQLLWKMQLGACNWGAVALEDGLAVAYKIKARPHDSTLTCLSKTRPHRILYVNDYSRTPQDSLQVATTHISISWRAAKEMWHIQTMGYWSQIKRKEVLGFATTWRDHRDIIKGKKSG